ncbi:MAG TPA: MBL fold metallo-hydrolase [Anaeromyxobacteraceae bacterium]|nr:MBL fold metallo-hydrolase [Anaeromyxobacteraceae bacterium]
MSEPKATARAVVRVAPGIYRWRVSDDRIGGGESVGHAVVERGRLVLIDPIPVAEGKLRRLGRVEAIVLSAACHQRSAWRFRRAFGVPVLGPRGPGVSPTAGDFLEAPDRRYDDGDRLPGGLRAVHAPGPTEAMFALWHPGRKALFLTDLLMRDGRGPLRFVPDQYQDEPARTRETLRRLHRRFRPQVLLLQHGAPVESGARAALAAALERDAAAARAAREKRP